MNHVAPPADLRVMIVDDEEPWLRSFSLTLQAAGLERVETLDDSRAVIERLDPPTLGVLVVDLFMPHRTGEEILAEMVERHPEIPVIVLTGINDVTTAVQCMKTGAFDYFVKTEEKERLIAGVRRALRFRELRLENSRLRDNVLAEAPRHPEAFAALTTRSATMRAVFRYVEAIAESTQPVLISGESGVGKELIARALHVLSGRAGPFTAVNVAGLDDNMFSDTLFGHVRGAFTGAAEARRGLVETARGGTLFLDEIGDLDNAAQVKLLRLLQEREYFPLGSDKVRTADVRVVVATHQSLNAAREAGRFRTDLYYRLNTHRVRIPPLRERPEDLPPLVERFLAEAAESLSRTVPTPPRELYDLLATYAFPGNVRELRSMVFDAVTAHESGTLSTRSFREHIRSHGGPTSGEGSGGAPEGGDTAADGEDSQATAQVNFGPNLPTLKRNAELLVEEAMRRANNNQTVAAGMLGITRQALSRRLKRSG